LVAKRGDETNGWSQVSAIAQASSIGSAEPSSLGTARRRGEAILERDLGDFAKEDQAAIVLRAIGAAIL
jgi:hypothetical protein